MEPWAKARNQHHIALPCWYSGTLCRIFCSVTQAPSSKRRCVIKQEPKVTVKSEVKVETKKEVTEPPKAVDMSTQVPEKASEPVPKVNNVTAQDPKEALEVPTQVATQGLKVPAPEPVATATPSILEHSVDTATPNQNVAPKTPVNKPPQPETSQVCSPSAETQPGELPSSVGPGAGKGVDKVGGLQTPTPSEGEVLGNADDELAFITISVPPPILTQNAIDNRLRRIFKARADGTYQVDKSWVDQYKDRDLRQKLYAMFEKVGYSPDRAWGKTNYSG